MESTYHFEAVTAYDKEAIRHYTTYHYRHVDRRAPLSFLVLGGLFTGLSAWRLLAGELLLPAVLGIFGLGLLLAGIRMLSGRASIKVPDLGDGRPPVNRQRFFEDRLEYAGQQTQGYYTYDQITRVGEDREYFYIYVQSNQALVVQKAGMTLGTPEQLEQFLDRKAPGRRQ